MFFHVDRFEFLQIFAGLSKHIVDDIHIWIKIREFWRFFIKNAVKQFDFLQEHRVHDYTCEKKELMFFGFDV